MAFSIPSVCQAYLVHLSFQSAFLSKPSEITSYCNWSLLCCCIRYFYALVWFLFFWQHYTAPFFCHKTLSESISSDSCVTSNSPAGVEDATYGPLWVECLQFLRASLCSVLLKAVICLHPTPPMTTLPLSNCIFSSWGLRPWKHLKQISRDCSPLNLWIF